MSINYLSSGFLATGVATTIYGLSSYVNAKTPEAAQTENLKKAALQKVAIGVSLIAIGLGISIYASQQAPDYIAAVKELATEKPISSYSYLGEEIPDYIAPYVKELAAQKPIEPLNVMEKFPSYFGNFPHPGRIASPEGNLCRLIPENQTPALEECQKSAKLVTQWIKKNFSFSYKYTMTDPSVVWQTGQPYWGRSEVLAKLNSGIDAPFEEITLGMSKVIVKNYQKAITEADSILPNICEKSETAIWNAIQKIHKVLMNNVIHPTTQLKILGGQLRNENICIFSETAERSAAGFATLLKERNGTPEDFKNLQIILQKFSAIMMEESSLLNVLTPSQIETVNKIIYFPTLVKDLKNATSQFAGQYKEICSQIISKKIHPIVASSWVHQAFGKLHPFTDGNGRIARILSGHFLLEGGIPPAVFPSDSEYVEAIVKDQMKPGSFVTYLTDVIRWNLNQTVFKA